MQEPGTAPAWHPAWHPAERRIKMITLIFSVVVLLSVPYFYKNSVHTKYTRLPACSQPIPGLFHEVHRLSGLKFDRTKLGVAFSILFILANHLYLLIYTNKSYANLFDFHDAIVLSFVMVALPIFGFFPLRNGYVLIDQVRICVPKVFSTASYPRESTMIWIHQIGNETHACVLRHKQQSTLLFLDKHSTDLLRDWAMC